MLNLNAVTNLETLNSLELQTLIVQIKAVQAFRADEGLDELEPETEGRLQAKLEAAERELGKRTSDALAAAEQRVAQKIEGLKTPSEKRSDALTEQARLGKLRKKLGGK